MQNYITLERLSKVFTTLPIPKEWFEALEKGHTRFYADDTCLLTHYVDLETGVLIINSMSREGKKFPKSMLLDIRELIISHDKVIIASSVQEIAQHMLLKYGFTYNSEHKVYVKGD